MTHDPHNPTAHDAHSPLDDLKTGAKREYADARHRLGHTAERAKAKVGPTLKTFVVDELDRQRTRLSGDIHSLSQTLHNGRKDGAPSPLAGHAANLLDRVSRGLDGQTVSDISRRLTQYGRTNPGLFLGAAVLAGLTVGRLFVASGQAAISSGKGAYDHDVHPGSLSSHVPPDRTLDTDPPSRTNIQPIHIQTDAEAVDTRDKALDATVHTLDADRDAILPEGGTRGHT